MPRLIYTLLLLLAAPIVWLWLLSRGRGGAAAWQPWAAERFGRFPQPWDGRQPVWVHAVSVGEVRAAKSLIQALALKGETVILTHLTPTGRAEGQRILTDEIRRGQVWQQWAPYDFQGSMRRFWQHFNPRLVILIEREVWPNLVHVAREQSAPIVLASARLSEKSLKQARWIDRLFGGLLHDTYQGITVALAQSDADAQRLFDAGVAQVQVCGNLKFDMQLPHVAVQAGQHWRQRLARPVVAIASTREGEDKPMVNQIKAYLEASHGAKPLFLLIPRHPQRFNEAARLLDGASCRYARWSVLRDDPASDEHLKAIDVVLGDTMGEMPFFYGAADIAVVGGSFERHGGQNFIEACAIGTPVIVGPHTYNFADAVASANQAGAIVQVQSPEQAFEQVKQWLVSPEAAQHVGSQGKSWVINHLGATERMMQAIVELEGGVSETSASAHEQRQQ
ncbi:3-deoxy-D-manno-octulosonic acid transferase [Orrella daihaiensis]|uniref:3-deoxy-D-manno-octulosonic acid transferase n=1 Tax=Orrella daihaiensis TaxID=2782176 RepID=A0ABY4ANT9_9BURK|nr:3-deoxy-D-manno-octulosonic acid transferase [Orrella daihaiensis]UOD51713.1 3-deoxy-D-manno-octulosonic acid transferase [Orrella daihaiensis]